MELFKKFEKRFESDFLNSVPDSFVYRLHDQVTGQKYTSRNPCDFICYKYPKMFLIECKTHKGNTLPFSAIRQYDELIKYKDKFGIVAGVVAWFYEHDKVVYIPITELEKMKQDGKKSVHINMLESKEYDVIEIPSTKLKVFMESDYSILMEK